MKWEKEAAKKANLLSILYLQAVFGGDKWCLPGRQMSNLKIFQAKLSVLNSIVTVKETTGEDHGMQMCRKCEFVRDVV